MSARRVVIALLALVPLAVQIRYSVGLINGWINGRKITELPMEVGQDPLRARPRSDTAKAAGVKDGDIVVAVDGKPVSSRIEYAHSLLSRNPGEEVVLRLRREGSAEPIDARLKLAPLDNGEPVSWPSFAAVFVGGIVTPWLCIGLGLFVAMRRPHDPAAIALVLFLWGISQIARVNEGQRYGWEPMFTWPALAFSAMAVGIGTAAWLWFCVQFPDPRSRFRLLPWSPFVLGLPLAIFSVLAGLTDTGMSHAPARFLPLARGLEGFPGWVLNWLAAVVLALGWANLIYKLLREDRAAARKLKLLLAGISVALLPAVGISIYGNAVKESASQQAQLIVTVLLLLVPVTMAYVVVVERAMDVSVVIRQGLQYALASRSVAVIRTVLMVALIWMATTLGGDASVSRPKRFQAIALCVAAVMLVRRASDWFKAWVDRRFFREAVDSERVLTDLSQQVHRIVDPQALLKTVSERVSSAMHVPYVAALAAEGGGIDGFPVPVVEKLREASSAVPVRDPALPGTELLLPLRSKDSLLGVLSLGPKQSEEPYSSSDLRLLESVAAQTGLALENSQLAAKVAEEAAHRERIGRELEIARDVQQRLFPKAPPQVEGLTLSGLCIPAQTIGGDYYDFLVTPSGEIGLAIGDVSGKGIPAALLMSGLQASLRALTAAGVKDLAELMTTLNRLIYDATPASRFATFFYGNYEPKTARLRYSSAGHNPALLLRANGDAEWLRTRGVGLGLSRASRYEQKETMLGPGDRLLLYTDGITEAMNEKREEFGEDRLLAAARSGDVTSAVRAFAGGAPQHDDITLIDAVRLSR